MNCALCDDKTCHRGEECGEWSDDARPYDEGEVRRFFTAAAEVEAEGYCRLGRVEELILFARKLGLRRLGIAFCVGLSEEARLLAEILGRCFEVSSVCCKVCAISKDELGLPKIHFESACNPVGQARSLADSGTELNVIVGLRIGHDILFTRASAAPVTTLVVKDRVLGHNPVAALHASYHRRRLLAATEPKDEP